jgi:hypothetical protein
MYERRLLYLDPRYPNLQLKTYIMHHSSTSTTTYNLMNTDKLKPKNHQDS